MVTGVVNAEVSQSVWVHETVTIVVTADPIFLGTVLLDGPDSEVVDWITWPEDGLNPVAG